MQEIRLLCVRSILELDKDLPSQYLPSPLFSITSGIFREFLRDAVCLPGNQKPQSHLWESFQSNLNNLNYDPANRNPHKFVKVQGRGGQQWRQRHALQSQHFLGKRFQHRLEYNGHLGLQTIRGHSVTVLMLLEVILPYVFKKQNDITMEKHMKSVKPGRMREVLSQKPQCILCVQHNLEK